MFSKQITTSDAFVDMPVSSQLLYFHLNMEADDDGFVSNPKRIMRMLGGGEDDLKVLLAKRFLLAFESGVVVIKHWLLHNAVRKDMYQETQYLEEKNMLKVKENKAYTEDKDKIRNVTVTKPVHRLDQVRLGKDRLDKVKEESEPKVSPDIKTIMGLFIEKNPSLKWGDKSQRKACAEMLAKWSLEAVKKMAEQILAVQGKPYAPVATTPYMMWKKIAQFKTYFDAEKGKSNKPTFVKV